MEKEKAFKIHTDLWQHVSFASLGMSDSKPCDLNYTLLELCEAEKIISELQPIVQPDGTKQYNTIVDERLIAAIFVSLNYEPNSRQAIVTYDNSHLVLVERAKS